MENLNLWEKITDDAVADKLIDKTESRYSYRVDMTQAPWREVFLYMLFPLIIPVMALLSKITKKPYQF
jgi:hypothetical protein